MLKKSLLRRNSFNRAYFILSPSRLTYVLNKRFWCNQGHAVFRPTLDFYSYTNRATRVAPWACFLHTLSYRPLILFYGTVRYLLNFANVFISKVNTFFVY